MKNISIHWFRKDLRLRDNPSLREAAKSKKILPIYILDQNQNIGEASSWWLHSSLEQLNNSLNKKLSFFIGDSKRIILKLVKEYNIKTVCFNNSYEPYQRKTDKKIKNSLKEIGVDIKTFNGTLLWNPNEILNNDNSYYKVFSAFYRKALLIPPREPLASPTNIKLFSLKESLKLNELKLLPKIKWYKKLENIWDVGEVACQNKLKKFFKEKVSNYKNGRDILYQDFTSRLSPHLHFGEISPHQLWKEINLKSSKQNRDTFCRQLTWREFSYYLLYYYQELPKKPFQLKFKKFKWIYNKKALTSWQRGLTGIPLVDAGMRELWQTGYMHNRARMIVGSFLVKNLLINWKYGLDWFWECLVDADLANNSFSWQWIAGCGTDASPYFRIFNPITQAKRFDPKGNYIRQFVPELKNLSNKYLFSPWEAPKSVLKQAGIKLGKDYPIAIVDLKKSRKRALDTFYQIRK